MSANQTLAIWNAVIATLKAATASGQALDFMKPTSIFDGVYVSKGDLPQGQYPAIIAELDQDDEQFGPVAANPVILSDFKMFLSCMVYESKPNKGITGDAGITGLLAFVSAVKNVLQADMTLGHTSGLQKISFPHTQFFFETYPIREAKISVTLRNQLTTITH